MNLLTKNLSASERLFIVTPAGFVFSRIMFASGPGSTGSLRNCLRHVLIPLLLQTKKFGQAKLFYL